MYIARTCLRNDRFIGKEAKKLLFTYNPPHTWLYMSHVMRKPVFAYVKSKAQISWELSVQLISAFVIDA